MKKTLTMISLVLLVLLAALLSFTACGEDHVHEFGEWVMTQDADCTREGDGQYYRSLERECSCGEKETDYVWIDDPHTYDECGFCERCGDVSEDRKDDLNGVVEAVCFTYWYLNYEISVPADDMKIYYSSIDYDSSKRSCELVGSVSIDREDDTYKGYFDITCKWSEEDNGFVREDGTFDNFYACDSSGGKGVYYFSNNKTFTHYNDYSKQSVLTFDTEGNLTQKMYNVYGSLVSTSYAVYGMAVTPKAWIISVTASNGNKITMTYYPDLNGLMWGDDAYISN